MSGSEFGIYNEDAKKLLPTLSKQFGDTDGLVDAVITSPPYADLKDYGGHEMQIGQQPYQSFLHDLREVFAQCYDVASESCTLWTVVDTFKRDNRIVRLPFDIADTIENLDNKAECDECGGHLNRDRGTGNLICEDCSEATSPERSWRMEDNIIWNKRRTLPWRNKGQLRNIHEHVSLYSKSDEFKYNIDAIRIDDESELSRWWVSYPERYHPRGKVPPNIWEYDIPKQGGWGPGSGFHPSPLPLQMVERIIRLTTDEGDVVLDPFCGVGSTLAVARALNRKPIGFELNEEYIDLYEREIRPEVVKTFEQQPLANQNGLYKKIWTLRMHKYALELCQAIAEQAGVEVSDMSINTILLIANRESLNPYNDNTPEMELLYVCDSDAPISDADLSRAHDPNDKNSQSGGYYGIRFLNKRVRPIGAAVLSLTQGAMQREDPLYLYTEGVHNRHKRELSVGEWVGNVGTQEWDPDSMGDWPPLVSNLGINQLDPTSDSVSDSAGDQANIGRYAKGAPEH